MKVNVGDRIRIIKMDDDDGKDWQAMEMNGKEGVVESIDDIGQLHGTWGGLGIFPGVDEFIIL